MLTRRGLLIVLGYVQTLGALAMVGIGTARWGDSWGRGLLVVGACAWVSVLLDQRRRN